MYPARSKVIQTVSEIDTRVTHTLSHTHRYKRTGGEVAVEDNKQNS